MPISIEAKHKHLEFIQLTITRMAANSFLLKGWCVTLVAALAALAAKDSKPDFVYIAFFPALAFWGLDAYFLRQEKLYRKLYNVVRKQQEEEIDYSLNTEPFNNDVESWFGVLFSKTLLGFYAVALATIILIALLTKHSSN